MTQVIHQARQLRALGAGAGPVCVVMTMGALHRGHAALIEQARGQAGAGQVIVTDFVNPTQFGAGEDYARYPRTLEQDVVLATAAGADVVYAPDVADVYGFADPSALNSLITIDPGPIGSILEGAARPGHFAGVLTVVAKLLHLTAADIAIFGEKDYQQLSLITAMVNDLHFPVEVIGAPTVREDDGLAMSSRNRYLDPAQRAAAAVIPAALRAVQDSAGLGEHAALEAGRAVLDSQPDVELDYLTITAHDLGPAPASGAARVLIAARIGSTRLIDNMPVVLGA